MESNPYQDRFADIDHEDILISRHEAIFVDRADPKDDEGYYGYSNQRDFERASENEVYCQHCESHPCDCDRRRS